MELTQTITPEVKTQQIARFAEEKYRGEPDWVSFFREVLGVNGIIDKLFPSFDDRAAFEQTPEYAEIQQMLARLRERHRVLKEGEEQTRVITVRLPQSLHESLRHEAHNHKTSMNKLCISKLLQVIADDLVPSDFEKREPEPVASIPVQSIPMPVATPHFVPSHGVPATPIHALAQPSGFASHRPVPQFATRPSMPAIAAGQPRAV